MAGHSESRQRQTDQRAGAGAQRLRNHRRSRDIRRFRARQDKALLRFIGLRRSGNHAILTWFAHQVRGDLLFLNNATASSDPFETCTETIWLPRTADPSTPPAPARLVISYEDTFFQDLERGAYRRDPRRFTGPHSAPAGRDVLILRDPYNTFASRLSRFTRTTVERPSTVDRFVAMWKQHARIHLGEEPAPESSRLTTVLFNRWFTDADYRADRAAALGVDAPDPDAVGTVSPFGTGSSFDGQKFDGHAQQMKVLTRWQLIADHPLFQKLRRDPELADLTHRIFNLTLHPQSG